MASLLLIIMSIIEFILLIVLLILLINEVKTKSWTKIAIYYVIFIILLIGFMATNLL